MTKKRKPPDCPIPHFDAFKVYLDMGYKQSLRSLRKAAAIYFTADDQHTSPLFESCVTKMERWCCKEKWIHWIKEIEMARVEEKYRKTMEEFAEAGADFKLLRD